MEEPGPKPSQEFPFLFLSFSYLLLRFFALSPEFLRSLLWTLQNLSSPLYVSLPCSPRKNSMCQKKTPPPLHKILFFFSFALDPSFPFVIQWILNFKYSSLFFFQSTTSLFFTPIKISFPIIPSTFFSRNSTHKLFVLKLNMHITYLSNNESI